ncbi:hypothetical protein D6764_05315 [Candidatus Woesearchaeota archaeon]|nr:MAG: hypothetical protein D6764_05315 [Candidatus Woesearchaeota archaeon]
MYYNFLQFKSMVKNGKLMKDNFEAGEKFGRIAVLEIYLQPGLEKMLEEENAPYFGTKKTLTECVRVLEGWDLERVPRLKSYVQYANEIEAWARDNFADYNRDEWFLGKEKSKDILRSRGTTNVREAVKAFWQNYLLNKEPRIAEDDVEIDIVWPEFREKRKPDIILVGEDIFNMNGEKNINDIVFRTSEKTVRIPMREEQNEKPFINAEFASDMFPSAEVYVVRYKGPVRFTLTKYDEVKEGVNHEVADLTRILANIL